MDLYEPELGQMLFGQGWKEYECPEYIIDLLRVIDTNLEIYHNSNSLAKRTIDLEYVSPFDNSGAKFESDVFSVEAYSWDEEYEQPYNFKCGDIEISWYKYLGRGTTINKQITKKEAMDMFNKCIESLK